MGFFFRKKDSNQNKSNNLKTTSEELELLDEIKVYLSKLGYEKESTKIKSIEILEKCKNDCKENGNANYSYIGEKIFELSESDTYLASCIKYAENDNASRTEIISWWSISELQRKVIQHLDELNRLVIFTDLLNKGMTSEQASNRIKKMTPGFGYSSDYHDVNRPISPEKKVHVEEFKRIINSSELMRSAFINSIEQFDSFNAYYRNSHIYKGV